MTRRDYRRDLRLTSVAKSVVWLIGPVEEDRVDEGEPDVTFMRPLHDCGHKNSALEADMDLRTGRQIPGKGAHYSTFGNVANGEIGRRAVDEELQLSALDRDSRMPPLLRSRGDVAPLD